MEKIIGALERGLSLSNPMLKYFIVCLLFFTIFAGAIPSHLLKVQYFASTQKAISPEEMDALNYLSTLKIPSGSYILTGFSGDMVYAMTGVSTLTFSDPIFSPLIFKSKSPGVVLWTLHYLNVSYIYLNVKELQFIENKYKNSFFMWLLSHFPVLFHNDQVTIYIVPPLSPPSDGNSIAVVTGDLLSYTKFLTKNFIWMDNDFFEGWKKSTVNNVESWNFTTDGNIATLEGKTIRGQQAAVFYVKDLKEPIPTSSDTITIIKFKSNTIASYAILDIIYSDGSNQRIILEGRSYMKSLDWLTVTNFLQPNKSVKTIRIGITDDKEGNGEKISVSFDYVAIAQAGKLTDYYVSSLIVSLMQINYTTISEFDPSLFNYNTIIVPDLNLTTTKTLEYINWIKNGGTLIVINSGERGAFSNFLGIKESGRYLSADFVVGNEGSCIKIPNATIPEIQINDASTTIIANYTLGKFIASPYALLKRIGEGKILYLEVAPILNLAESQDFIKTMEWTRDLLQNYVDLTLFNSSAYGRTFYVKNIGEISLQVQTHIATSSVIFSFDELRKVTLSFSNGSKVQNIKSSFENVTMSNIEIRGATPVTIQVNGNVTLSPLDSNRYIKLKLNGEASFQFFLNHNNEVQIFLKNGNSAGLRFHDGVLLIHIPHAENIELIVSNPIITNNGTTTFDSLFASYPYKFTSSGNRGTSTGQIEFKVKLSEEKVMLLDKVLLKGNLYGHVLPTQTYKQDLFFFNEFPLESLFFTLATILFTIFIYINLKDKWYERCL
ncbi:MAG: hypothetical protein ACPL3B_01765 [Fervidobacterium sp.]